MTDPAIPDAGSPDPLGTEPLLAAAPETAVVGSDPAEPENVATPLLAPRDGVPPVIETPHDPAPNRSGTGRVRARAPRGLRTPILTR